MAEVQTETSADFEEKVTGVMAKGIASMGIAIGLELGLFKLLETFETPKTAAEIAEAADMKERYIKEWLGQMSCLKVVDISPDGLHYFFPKHRRGVLTSQSISVRSMVYYLLAWGRLFPQLNECFKKDGPRGLPYSMYDHLNVMMTEMNIRKTELNPNYSYEIVETVPTLPTQLEQGISVCEIGCGPGIVLLQLAEKYPKSTFVGNEYQPEYVRDGNAKAKELGLTNVEFKEGDACSLPGDWSEIFDYVMVYNTIHDLPRPDLGLKEVHRILKQDGVFSMMDQKGSTNQANMIDIPNSVAMYGMSLFHCIPTSLHAEGGLGLGCMFGIEKARQLLSNAGFVITIETEAPVPGQAKFHLICKKTKQTQ